MITPWNHGLRTISSLTDIPEGVFGFVYKLKLYDKKHNLLHEYIGKKNLYSVTKRKFGKKEIALLKDKRKKRYEMVKKESDWKTYCSSNKFIKENKDKFVVHREILSYHYSDTDLSFAEAKAIICSDALQNPKYLNDAVSIKRINKPTDENN